MVRSVTCKRISSLKFLQGFELFFAEAKAVWERPYDQRHTWEAI